MPGPWWAVFFFYLGTFVVSALGAGAAGYFKKRGENLATHDDLNLLVDQVKAVTQTTKDIEAKISGDMWDRQRRWNMKREVLFQAAKRFSDIEQTLLSLNSVLQLEREKARSVVLDPPEAALLLTETKTERLTQWWSASTAFDETTMLVNIVCSKEAYWALQKFGVLMNQIAADLSSGKDLDAYKKSTKERELSGMKARRAIRNELEVDTGVTPQSNESSAVPAPGKPNPAAKS